MRSRESTAELAGNSGGWIASAPACTELLSITQLPLASGSVQAGAQAIHPRLLGANAKSPLSFNCGGKTHSKLTFWYQGYAPTAGQSLNLYVDNALYQTYGQTAYNGFTQVDLTVASGTHTYKWEATTAQSVAGQPPYWLDSIVCE